MQVRTEGHRYLREIEVREEGGTPNIVGAVRAGLVFQLKSLVTADVIMAREHYLFRKAKEAWQFQRDLIILGPLEADRLPVFSFLVRHFATGSLIHHNFVSVILNDLFGIQARGGCACAGPYAMDLLGVPEDLAIEIEHLLAEDRRPESQRTDRHTEDCHREIFKPGFTRLNLPYFMTEEELDFVLQAVTMVTRHGWTLLPQYTFVVETGEWKHRTAAESSDVRDLSYTADVITGKEVTNSSITDTAPSLKVCLGKAAEIFNKAWQYPQVDEELQQFDETDRPFIWFLLPSQASRVLRGQHLGTPVSDQPSVNGQDVFDDERDWAQVGGWCGEGVGCRGPVMRFSLKAALGNTTGKGVRSPEDHTLSPGMKPEDFARRKRKWQKQKRPGSVGKDGRFNDESQSVQRLPRMFAFMAPFLHHKS
ncbi:uncharacterized protein [Littorina saxatilis]|uniref:uncharacterized protein n=1 Tax=Littorina saxatilis TaxID=31220 RepID=UPI0038B66AAB